MRNTAKSLYGTILGLILLTIPVPLTSSLGIETRKWYRMSNNTMTLINTTSASASSASCAAVCLQRNGCVQFCYDNVRKACHLTASVSFGVAAQKDRLKCYKSTKQADTKLHQGNNKRKMSVNKTLGCAAHDGCPADKGYSLFEGCCIRLYHTNVVGDSAQSQCHQDGGHLYYFKDDSNDKKAAEKLLSNRSFSFSGDVRLWVGARRSSVDTYQWDDGALVDHHLWNSGEPTDNSDCCVVLRPDYKLANNACTENRSFICQFDV